MWSTKIPNKKFGASKESATSILLIITNHFNKRSESLYFSRTWLLYIIGFVKIVLLIYLIVRLKWLEGGPPAFCSKKWPFQHGMARVGMSTWRRIKLRNAFLRFLHTSRRSGKFAKDCGFKKKTYKIMYLINTLTALMNLHLTLSILLYVVREGNCKLSLTTPVYRTQEFQCGAE